MGFFLFLRGKHWQVSRTIIMHWELGILVETVETVNWLFVVVVVALDNFLSLSICIYGKMRRYWHDLDSPLFCFLLLSQCVCSVCPGLDFPEIGTRKNEIYIFESKATISLICAVHNTSCIEKSHTQRQMESPVPVLE